MCIRDRDNQYINKDKHLYYWQLGYQADFADGWTLHAGYTGRTRSEAYETHVAVKGESGFVETPEKSYLYDYDRTLNLLYASLGKQWGAFHAEVGAQAELSHAKIVLAGGGTTNTANLNQETTNRFHLYPRAAFSYRIDKQQEL